MPFSWVSTGGPVASFRLIIDNFCICFLWINWQSTDFKLFTDCFFSVFSYFFSFKPEMWSDSDISSYYIEDLRLPGLYSSDHSILVVLIAFFAKWIYQTGILTLDLDGSKSKTLGYFDVVLVILTVFRPLSALVGLLSIEFKRHYNTIKLDQCDNRILCDT